MDAVILRYDFFSFSNFHLKLYRISIKVTRRPYGSSCDYTYQCVIGLGLICPSTGSTCTCDNGVYWTGSICGINHFKIYFFKNL